MKRETRFLCNSLVMLDTLALELLHNLWSNYMLSYKLGKDFGKEFC